MGTPGAAHDIYVEKVQALTYMRGNVGAETNGCAHQAKNSGRAGANSALLGRAAPPDLIHRSGSPRSS